MRPVLGRKPLAGSSLVMRHSMAQPRGCSQPGVHPHRQAGRDPELLAHQVHPIDQLGHRVLDLDAGVHLEEVERAVGRQQELAGAGAAISNRLRRGHGGGAHPLPQLVVHRDRGRLLDQLLMTALDRALALAQVHGAGAVGEHLDLDVARPLNEFLEVDPGVAEGFQRLARGGLERAGQLVRRPHHPHPLPASAGRRLHHHRISEFPRKSERRTDLLDRRAGAGDDRHPRGLHAAAGLGLVAHRADRGGRRSDPDEAGLLHRLRERGAFGEKAVARVHGVGPARQGSFDQPLDGQVALRRGRWPDGDGAIGGSHVRARPVRRRSRPPPPPAPPRGRRAGCEGRSRRGWR